MADRINPKTIDTFTKAPRQANPTTGDAYLVDRGGTIQYVLQEDLKQAIVDDPATTDGSIQELVEGACDGVATTFSFSVTTPTSSDNVFMFIDGRLRRDFTLDGQDVVFDEAPEAGETYVLVHWQTVGGGGGGGVTDHGALTGLSDDDHTQYSRTDGTRAFTGNIDLGGHAVTNVGNVDGRDVSVDGTKLDTIATGAQVNPTQVSAGEITAGTGTSLRSYAPADVKAFVTTHAPGGGDMLAATYDPGGIADDAFDMTNMVEGANAKKMTAAERTKLAGIEAAADVTDSTNVDAAGAVMNSDSDTTPMAFVVDEDSMASNLATKVPTQQSVKAYGDGLIFTHQSTYDHDAYDAHVASPSNPHSVTAAQTGAYTSGETDALLADKQDVLSEGEFVDGDKTKLDSIATGAVAEGATGDAYASSHESDTTAHPAANIVNTPAGNISATTVQAAINELDTEKEAAGTAASAISTHEGTYDHSLIATALQPEDVGTAAAEDVGYFATAAQGTLADSAVQPGDNVSDLVNDAGYVTSVTTSARDMFKIPYAISDTNPPSAAAQATNTYTLTNNPSPGDTVTLSDDNCVGSFVITFDTDVAIGGSIAATVTNLVDYLMTGAGGLNYFSTPCTFNDNGADFEVTAWVAGDHMNTYRVTFDIAAGNPTNNGDALAGGVTGLSAWNMPIGASATYSTGSEQSNLESVPVSGVSVNFNYIYPAGYPRCHFLANTTDPLTLIKDNLQGSGVGMPFQVPVAPSWRTSEISSADNNTMIMFPALYETGKDAADPYHYEYVGLFHANFATVVNGVTAPSARILYATSSRAALNAGSPSSPRSYWQQHPMGLGHTNFAYTDPTNAWNGATLYPSWPTAAQLPCIPYSASELQEDTAINRAVPVAIGGDLMAHSSNVGSDAATVIWPASGRDANHSLCSGWVPYGSRICIDKDFDIDAYCDANACGDITRKVLHGWQDWGMIVIDIGGADSRLDFWVSTDCDSSTRSELQTQISAFRYANPDAFVRITNTAATQLTAGGGAARAEYFSATFTGTPGTGHNPSVSTGGGAVSSVFGRAGAVTQQVGDYTSVQITQADGASDIVVGYPIWLDPDDATGTTNFTRGVEQIAAGIAAGAKAFSLMPAGGHFVYDGTFRICGAHTGLDGDGGSGSLIEGIPLFANGCTLECPSTRTSANYEPLLSPQLDGSDYAALSDFFVNDGEPYIWGPGINKSTKVADTSFSSSGSDWTYDTATVPLGMAKDNAGVMTRLLQVSTLDYDGETVSPTGTTAIGATSGATARVVRLDDAGTTGTLWLTSIKGTFENDETVNLFTTAGAAAGTVVANGTVDPYPTTLADDEWALTATPGVRVGLVTAGDRFWLTTNDAGNVVDQGGRFIDYDVFFDVCGTARFHVIGSLTLIVPRDQYVVALAASRQGPKDSRGSKSGGRENFYDNITIVNAPIGLGTNPIGSPYWDGDAAVYADEDGQVPFGSAATIGHLACTDVIRPIVCSSDRSDNFTILSGSMNGVRASSIFHGVSGTHIGPIRGTFNSETASGTSGQDGHDEPFFEFLNGSYNIVNPFVHSAGAAPTTAGMAGIIRAAKCSIAARNIKHDNTAGRDDYPWFVILDKPRNLFSRLGAGDYQLHFDPNMTLSGLEAWVTAAVALTSYNYTGSTRNSNNVTVRMPFVDVADIEAVEIIGSETTADTFYVETRDTNQHYRIDSGALVTCDSNGLRHNLAATTDWSATDDADSHYGVGSRWVNTTTGREFVCVDATATAAVWRETSSDALEVDEGNAAGPTLTLALTPGRTTKYTLTGIISDIVPDTGIATPTGAPTFFTLHFVVDGTGNRFTEAGAWTNNGFTAIGGEPNMPYKEGDEAWITIAKDSGGDWHVFCLPTGGYGLNTADSITIADAFSSWNGTTSWGDMLWLGQGANPTNTTRTLNSSSPITLLSIGHGTTQDTYTGLRLSAATSSLWLDSDSASPYTWLWSFVMAASTANRVLRIGIGRTLSSDASPVSGAYLEYDSDTDSTYHTVTHSATGTRVRKDTGVAPSADTLVTVQCHHDGVDMFFFIDGVHVTTHTSASDDLPAHGQPMVTMAPRDTTERAVLLRYFELKAPSGITRAHI